MISSSVRFGTVILGILLLLLSSTAQAQPVASCALSTQEASPFVGESFETKATFRNTGSGPGFGPALELYVPPHLSLSTATALGTSLTHSDLGIFSGSGTLVNSNTTQQVSGPSGYHLVWVQLPLSSLPPGAGEHSVSLRFTVASATPVGTVLQPQVSCLFALGRDALNNPSTDPVIRSDSPASGTDQAGVTATASALKVRMTAPASTVTGPNFPVSYRVEVDVAEGQTVTGARIEQTLPNTFQLVNVAASSGGTVLLPSSPPLSPGSAVRVDFPSITGTASSADAVVTLTGFVPRLDAEGVPVLDPSCGAGSTRSISHTAFVRNARLGAQSLADVSSLATFQARAEQVQEAIVNLSTPGQAFRPGQDGQLTLKLRVSDFFALESVGLTSTLTPGLTFQTGSSTLEGAPEVPVMTGEDPTRLFFALADLSGNETGGTERTLIYRFEVDERYTAGGTSVQGGDVLFTHHTLASIVPGGGGCALSSNEVAGGANASVEIASAGLSTQLLAINGSAPVDSPPRLRAGDEVTFRVALDLPSGDQSGFEVTEFLPSPLFDAREHGVTPVLSYGPGHNLPLSAGVTVSTSPASENNAVRLEVGSVETAPSSALRFEVDLTFTVLDSPREDGRRVTQWVQATIAGSNDILSASAAASFEDLQPQLVITRGAVASSKSFAVFTPSSLNTGAPYTSSNLDAVPVRSDVQGLDAQDSVVFRIIVQNRGQNAAYNVSLSDLPPAGMSCVVTGVTDGTGSALASTGNPFTGALSLVDPLEAYSATSGQNIAVVHETCTLQNTVTPNQRLEQTARLVHFTSTPSPTAPNFADGSASHNDASFAQVSPLILSNTYSGSAGPTVGDLVPFTMTVSIPEGSQSHLVITHEFPTQLAYAASSAPDLILPPGVTGPGGVSSVPGTLSSDGRTLSWSLASLTNVQSDDAVETATLHFDAVVLNAANFSAGNSFSHLVKASIDGVGVATVNSADLTLQEPMLSFSQVASPPSADAGDTVTLTATLLNPTGVNQRTAHEASYSFTAPSGCESLANASVSGVTGSASISGAMVTANIPVIAPGQSAVVSFTCTVPSTITIGTTLVLPGRIAWSSQAGVPAQAGLNPRAFERSGDISQAGGTANNYRRTQNTNLTIEPLAAAQVRVGSGDVTVGQQVSFDVSVDIPEGSLSSLVLSETLSPGLAFVATAGALFPPSVTCGGVPCVLPTPVVTQSGREIRWTLSDLFNSDLGNGTAETLTFNVTVVVTNDADVVQGASLSASFNAGASSATSVMEVAEPTLSGSVISVIPPIGDAGDAVVITVQVKNEADATAHDARVLFNLPPGLSAAGGYASATCPAPAENNLVGFNPSVTFAALPVGADCTFSFAANFTDSISPGQAILASGSLVWSSLAGEVLTSQSVFNPLAVERTGSTLHVGGAENDYSRPLVLNLTGAGGTAAVQKSFVGTNHLATSGRDIGLGEQVTYRLRVTLPEGTLPHVRVADVPPPGLRLVSVQLDTSGFGGSVGQDPSGPLLATQPGQSQVFDLGTVMNPGNNVADDELSLLVVAQAVFDPAVLSSTQLNSASLSVEGATLAGDSEPVEQVVPRPQLSAFVSTASPAAQEEVVVSASITNAASSVTGPLCHPVISTRAPPGFTLIDPAVDSLDNDDDGSTDEPDESGLLSAGRASVTVPGCFEASETTVVRVLLRANIGVPATPVSLMVSLDSYGSLPGGGESVNPALDLFDTNGEGHIDEASDAEVHVALTPVAPVLSFTKTAADINGAYLLPGEIIEYTLTLANSGTGRVHDAAVTDVLPLSHATWVSGSAFASQGMVEVTNGVLTARLGHVEAGSQATVTVQLQVDTPTVEGTVISNQAALATSDGYGGLQSDDPSTLAVGDSTRIHVSSADDIDGDGIPNDEDVDPNDPMRCGDRDRDSCDDCSVEGTVQQSNDGPDTDSDGLCNLGDPRPLDADSDDDGVLDAQEHRWDEETDGDGLINALDPDSDNDGILDGTELGVTVAHAHTDVSRGFFVPDAHPLSQTDPLLADSDLGGVPDGAEDVNKNGRVDEKETDPLNPMDDLLLPPDTDGDGLSDAEEEVAGSSPTDGDTDDDGVVDGAEPNWNRDSDGDGLINVLDADSDNDGLLDGTELGLMLPAADTDVSRGRFKADQDTHTRTSPVIADTDGGGARDGAEDANGNGQVDPGETDPLDASDDLSLLDSDGDGLGDAEEMAAGSHPNDADSDDDGLIDGAEPNWNQDSDGDGRINALDSDSDDDEMKDGTEAGVVTPHADTDETAGQFLADADPSTHTSPIVADTDGGGVMDSVEDLNQNGRRDPGETDPRVGADDDLNQDADGDSITDVMEGPKDGDGDGLPNALDTDSDGDTVLDKDEAGDSVLSTPPVDTDRDGFPDPYDVDSDGDGVGDDRDNCRRVPNTDQRDSNGNGRGDLCDGDTDADGVDDVDDNCLYDPNPEQEDADQDGLGDPCDLDDDNDGIRDGIGSSGGGCAGGVGASSVGLAWILLVAKGRRKLRRAA